MRGSYKNTLSTISLDHVLSLAELRQRFEARGRNLFHLQVELTSICNNRCLHCYVLQSGNYTPRHLSSDFVLALWEAAAAEGVLFLALTGGEPLLHPDFPRLYEAAIRKGFLVTLLSNGTLIDEPMADFLAGQMPYYISLSVYGVSADTYARVTGNPAGQAALFQAIDLLRERRVPLRVNFMLLRENYQEWPEFVRWAEQSGLPYSLDGGITPTHNRDLAPLQHALPAEDLARIECSLPKGRQELAEQCARRQQPQGDFAFQCLAGVDQMFVNASGWASVCVEEPQSWPLDPQDVHGSLRRLFYEEFPRFLAQERLDTECQECSLWSLCRRCPAWRYKLTGRHGARVPYFCELARAEAQMCAEANLMESENETNCQKS